MSKLNLTWPVLTTYDQGHLGRIAMPLGGIGTGTVSLGGRGQLQDFEIVNRPAKGFVPDQTFFALFVRSGRHTVTRALEGAIEPPYEGPYGSRAINHGLPRFRRCEFAAAYPLGQVLLSDAQVPVDVRIEAFNPLVPGDVDASSIPAAVLRFVLTNKTHSPVTASVCGTLTNFIGRDGTNGIPSKNVNDFRRKGSLRGLLLSSQGVDPAAEQWGTMALATTSGDVTYRTAWAKPGWGGELLDFWDDFSDDGRLEKRDAHGQDAPNASLAASVKIPARGQKSVTFLLTWHFPNRMTWTPLEPPATAAPAPAGACGEGCDCSPKSNPNCVGNYYTTRYRDAWDAACRTAAGLKRLEARTVRFVETFVSADIPDVVKEAALYNVSTLRTQTTFRIADGHLMGWEGCADSVGCCYGTCTHVWNYEQTTPYLFPELSKGIRDIEFGQQTDASGLMSFRTNLPLSRKPWHRAAADGQMGTIMRFYRDWQLTGDHAMLRKLWPAVKRALQFAWIPGGWDADKDGVMEGCQHNTMDVEYYGPNPQMEGWYLGALRAAEEMAAHLGETDFAARCRDLFERGRAWTDGNLFNGQYYQHEIRTIAGPSTIAPGLQTDTGSRSDYPKDPNFQLGAGCLVDQLVGQFMAHVCGLGHLLDAANVRKTLQSILKYNFRENFFGHFNTMRSFVLNDESALLMATYPLGRRPRRPFPYYTEVMTGFEYAAAIGMLQEGMTREGLKCIKAIRDRYDGLKRSPFDEAECGHHYARAMIAWAAMLAMTGFGYSAVTRTMRFAPARGTKAATFFWSIGGAYGTFTQKALRGGVEVVLSVIEGKLDLATLTLKGVGEATVNKTLSAGKSVKALIRRP